MTATLDIARHNANAPTLAAGTAPDADDRQPLIGLTRPALAEALAGLGIPNKQIRMTSKGDESPRASPQPIPNGLAESDTMEAGGETLNPR